MAKVREIEEFYDGLDRAANPRKLRVTFKGSPDELDEINWIASEAMFNNMDIELHNNRYKPVKIEFEGDKTKCTFPDGHVRIAKPNGDDEFDPEFGVMACIAKQVYGTRSEFKREVNDAWESHAEEVLEEFEEALLELMALTLLVQILIAVCCEED